jgi:hypothetical protein
MDKSTIERYHEWKRKAQPDHRFAVGDVTYSQAEMDVLAGGKPAKQINIKTDIEEETYADVGESHPAGHNKDAGTGISQSAE